MKTDFNEIKLLELRLEFLQHMSRMWDENATVQDIATELFRDRYKIVSDHTEFMKALETIHEKAKKQRRVIF